MNQMLLHDLLHILHVDETIPDRLRIDHHHRPMLALVQTPGLIRPYRPLQPRILDRVLESPFQLPAAFAPATRPCRILVAFIRADKQMMPKLCQIDIPSLPARLCDAHRFLRQYQSDAT